MSTTSASIPSIFLDQVVKLNGDNWHTWQAQILMVLRLNESDEIVCGKEPEPDASEVEALKEWKWKNKLALTLMWSRIEPELQHLVLDKSLGSVAFRKLKDQFKRPSLSRRIALRKAFFGAIHDPSKTVDKFINNVLSAKARLETIGITIDDTAVKDVILMNLDDSFRDIKNTLFASPTEPDLATVCSFLTAYDGPFVNTDATTIELEPEETVKLSTRSGKCGRGRKGGNGRLSSSVDSNTSESNHGHSAGCRDEKGYRWCNPSHDNHCHRCGRTGHIAARCISDMPPEIKAWAIRCPGREKQSLSTPPKSLTIMDIDESDDGEISWGKSGENGWASGCGPNCEHEKIVFEKCL